jgi:CDP-paratose 2-epimerase
VLLEMLRRHAASSPFFFMSTNKVYGDSPNSLPFIEQATRWECNPSHPYGIHGIAESMNIDTTIHSLFGVSKTSADLMVQEYRRYFGIPTVCFRGGCLTGPAHSGAALHGFLSWLVKCAVSGQHYTVFGYKGSRFATTYTPMIWLPLFKASFASRGLARSTTSAVAATLNARCWKQ